MPQLSLAPNNLVVNCEDCDVLCALGIKAKFAFDAVDADLNRADHGCNPDAKCAGASTVAEDSPEAKTANAGMDRIGLSDAARPQAALAFDLAAGLRLRLVRVCAFLRFLCTTTGKRLSSFVHNARKLAGR